VLKPFLFAAVAAMLVTPAMAQMAPAKPATTKVTVATTQVATRKATTVTRGPRTAKSLACSKDADSKNLHGAPRDKFMRGCNK
jgi:hypothetical protein